MSRPHDCYVGVHHKCADGDPFDLVNGLPKKVSEETTHERLPPKDTTVGVEDQPGFLENLAHGLSLCCLKETVPFSVAADFHSIFPAAQYLSVALPVLPHTLLSIGNLAQEGRCLLAFLLEANTLVGRTFTNKRMMSSRMKTVTSSGGLLDLEYIASQWQIENYLCVPLILDNEQSLLQAALASASGTASTSAHLQHECQTARIIEQYVRLCESGKPCVGVITLGLGPNTDLSARQLANACLLACASSKYLAADWSNFLDIANHPVCSSMQPALGPTFQQTPALDPRTSNWPGSQPSSTDLYRHVPDVSHGTSTQSYTTCSTDYGGYDSQSDDELFSSEEDEEDSGDEASSMDQDVISQSPPERLLDVREGHGDNFSATGEVPMEIESQETDIAKRVHSGSVSCREEQLQQSGDHTDSDDEEGGDFNNAPSSGPSNDAVSSTGKSNAGSATHQAGSRPSDCQQSRTHRSQTHAGARSTASEFQLYFRERYGWSDWRTALLRCVVMIQLLFFCPIDAPTQCVLVNGFNKYLPVLLTSLVGLLALPISLRLPRLHDGPMVVLEILNTVAVVWYMFRSGHSMSGRTNAALTLLKGNLLVAVAGLVRDFPLLFTLMMRSSYQMVVWLVLKLMQQLSIPAVLLACTVWPTLGSFAVPLIIGFTLVECQARRLILTSSF